MRFRAATSRENRNTCGEEVRPPPTDAERNNDTMPRPLASAPRERLGATPAGPARREPRADRWDTDNYDVPT